MSNYNYLFDNLAFLKTYVNEGAYPTGSNKDRIAIGMIEASLAGAFLKLPEEALTVL
ncbi:MAG: hypothetical protein ACFCUU_04255 [Cyclobacteriaceae bacterium]